MITWKSAIVTETITLYQVSIVFFFFFYFFDFPHACLRAWPKPINTIFIDTHVACLVKIFIERKYLAFSFPYRLLMPYRMLRTPLEEGIHVIWRLVAKSQVKLFDRMGTYHAFPAVLLVAFNCLRHQQLEERTKNLSLCTFLVSKTDRKLVSG